MKPCKDRGELTRSRSVSITARKKTSIVHVRNEREVGEEGKGTEMG